MNVILFLRNILCTEFCVEFHYPLVRGTGTVASPCSLNIFPTVWFFRCRGAPMIWQQEIRLTFMCMRIGIYAVHLGWIKRTETRSTFLAKRGMVLMFCGVTNQPLLLKRSCWYGATKRWNLSPRCPWGQNRWRIQRGGWWECPLLARNFKKKPFSVWKVFVVCIFDKWRLGWCIVFRSPLLFPKFVDLPLVETAPSGKRYCRNNSSNCFQHPAKKLSSTVFVERTAIHKNDLTPSDKIICGNNSKRRVTYDKSIHCTDTIEQCVCVWTLAQNKC